MNVEKQIKELDNQLTNKRDYAVDVELVLQYARYPLKHLSDIMFGLRNPIRRAAFFGIMFNEMPSYADLDFETHKNRPLPGVNGLFRCILDAKSTSGGSDGAWSRSATPQLSQMNIVHL